MDALYLLRHSPHEDLEIRYSLRSLERHASFVGKVWIFGDRPNFLTDDTSMVEHVPHTALAKVIGATVPVRNIFLLLYLATLIPGIAAEFLRFSDDYILLADLSAERGRDIRYLADLSQSTSRGKGQWRECLWRSYDLLRGRGLSGYNFETHVPTLFRRQWIMDAFCEFRASATPDRYLGLIGNTEILNLAHKREGLRLVKLSDEQSKAGFWGSPPAYEDVVQKTAGKTFFNFDDAAFGPGIRRFLAERFPNPSRYEKSPCLTQHQKYTLCPTLLRLPPRPRLRQLPALNTPSSSTVKS